MRFVEFLGRLFRLNVFPIFFAYVVLTFVGPYMWKKYKRNQELSLLKVMLFYNMLCSVLSLYTFVGLSVALYNADQIYSNSENPEMTPYFKIYGYTKVLELMDTVFMILRNRGRQITVLHVYHHSTMVLLVFYALQYSAWAALAPGIALNSFIHVLMYFYYGYTGYVKSSSRPAWKRRLTELQMIQFLIDLVYCAIGILYHDFCIWSAVYGSSMLFFFTNFYIKAYIYPRKKPTNKEKASNKGSQGSLSSSHGDELSRKKI